jgi:hypothetical protein
LGIQTPQQRHPLILLVHLLRDSVVVVVVAVVDVGDEPQTLAW